MAEFDCNEKGEQVAVQHFTRMFDNKVNHDANRRPVHCEYNDQTMAQPQRENNSNSRKSLEIKQTIEEIKRGYKVLVLMRGVPGAGKSTLAKSIIHNTIGNGEVTTRNHILSTDDYFSKFGKYHYDPRKLSEAHGWNHQRANLSMSQGFSPVIIDNTNIAMWEMRPYAIMATDYGYIVRIIEPDTHWCFDVHELCRRNTHNVPKATLKSMLEKYEKNVTPSKLLAAYDCRYQRQKPPQFRMHPSLDKACAQPDFDKAKQSSVDDILLQNGDTSFLKTPVLKPVQQSLSLFDNISAWGIDEAAVRSWDIVVPLEPTEPPVVVLNSSDEEVVVEMRDFYTETTEEDFDSLRKIESEFAKDVKVLVARYREINVNYQPKPRGIAKKLMIDRSCNTEDSHEAHLESLERVFSNVSPKTIHYWYRKCNQDFSWTMELLLAETEETINVIIEQSEVEDEQPPLPHRIAITSSDSSSSDESNVIKKKLHKKRWRHASDESESLKKSIESKVTIADAHYSDQVLKVKQQRFGQSEPNHPSTSTEEIDTDTDNNELSASPTESETIELHLGDQLVQQLEQIFGDPNLLYPKGFQPVVQMPVNIAKQLFSFYIESVYQQMAAQKAVMEDLVKEDEEFARKLQEMENCEIDEALKPDPTDIPDIVREQRELSKQQKKAEKWKGDTPDTLAAKLTRDKLFRLFPSLDRNALLEILHAHDNVYKDTVETLIASTGLSSQIDIDNVIKLPIEPEVMEEMREAHDNYKQQEPELEEPCSATDYREKANRYLQKRMELYEKAYRHYQSGSREVAQFYSGLATQQTRLFDLANGLAATAFLDEHSRRLENFNTLDLHFLYVKEAIPHLDIYLDRLINLARLSHSKRMESIQIITGWGKNSANGVAKIRPAVMARLKERKLWYMTSNPGLLKTKVGCNSLLSSEL